MPLEQEWNLDDENIEVICIDCFDTLLHRICSADEILNIWCRMLAGQLPFSEKTIREIWDLSRKVTAQRAEKMSMEEASFYDVALEMYVRAKELDKTFLYSIDEFVRVLKEEMARAENSRIVVNSELVAELIQQKRSKRKIVCISDFYMPGSWLYDLFKMRNIDFLFDRIYVSSDVGLRKSSGNLYGYVLHDLRAILPDITYNNLFMLGDNRLSDYSIPQKMGIQAYRFEDNAISRKINRMYHGFMKIYKSNVQCHLPFSNYSFSLFWFCRKLLSNLKKENLNEVWFFSREGKILKRFFEEYLLLCNEKGIKCHYINISRQSTFFPSLSKIDIEDFYCLKVKTVTMSLKDFLDTLGIFECCFPLLDGEYDFEKVERNFFESDIFSKLKSDQRFISVYEQERVDAKQKAIHYFRSKGICLQAEKKYAVVDIGWKGSIQDCLYKIFDGKYKILGYYYGLVGDVKITEGNYKTGLIFSDFPVRTKGYGIYRINYRMLERVLYADHGSCLKYEADKAVLKRVSKNEAELYEFVEPMQQKIIEEFGSIYDNIETERHYGNDLVAEMAILKIQTYFCVDINREKFNHIEYMDSRIDMNFGDFGNGGPFIKFKLKQIYRIAATNRVEMVQKLELILFKLKMGVLANAVGFAAKRRLIR